jgi:methylmalonyl-CoA mutase cobalamin-binding subunit
MRILKSARDAAVVLLASALMAGCTPEEDTPVLPAPVPPPAVAGETDDATAALDISIGLVMPSIHGPGSAYHTAAEGARVARYRFERGGANVDLVVAMETGTEQSVSDALKTLMGKDVAAIVAASAGPHLRAALANTPVDQAVILPYDTPTGISDGIWTTGASPQNIAARLTEAMQSSGVARPYLVSRSGYELPGINAVVTGTATTPTELAADIVAQADAGTVDSVVITAAGAEQAAIVAALQPLLGTRQLPLFLSSEAVTPVFATDLATAGATAATLITAGVSNQDAIALTDGPDGEFAAAFFTAAQLAAADANCLNTYADAPFSESAYWADLSSHDAVVSVVRAVEAAGSADPTQVRQALAALSIDSAAGLAGPRLDFTNPAALAETDVVVMRSSTSDPGLRPLATGDGQTRIFWLEPAT